MESAQTSFTDYGAAAKAAESRTAAVCANGAGDERVVIAAKGFLLIVDPADGSARQVPFPDGNREYPYQCFADSGGRFYTGAGPMLLVLDPFRGEYVDCLRAGSDGELVGFSFAEDGKGAVYFTAYPTCRLFRYDPASGTVEACARLDEREQYPNHLAVDEHGWVYAGIGTARKNIVAYHPPSCELRSLVPDAERTRGMGYVHQSAGGRVYGHWALDDLREGGAARSETYRWMRFREGRTEPVPWHEVEPSLYSGEGFGQFHRQLTGEWRVVRHDLAERTLLLASAAGGRTRAVPLAYACEGAQLSPLAAGPDGRIYGTTNHPLQLFRFDPHTGELVNFGGRAVEGGAGGNICAYATAGSLLAGAVYPGGQLVALDVNEPLVFEGERRNPRRLTAHEEIFRPRCLLAHSDGRHLIYGGFPGYGAAGGGLCLYRLDTGEETLIPHDRLVPYHSTLCLAEGSAGDVYGGTSVETPGGASPRDTRAKLYRLNWRSRFVEQVWEPLDAREIAWIAVDGAERIHGMTSEAVYFVFDPRGGRLLQAQDLSGWGRPVRAGMVRADAGRLYGALSGALYEVDLALGRAVRIVRTPVPVTAGLALAGNRLFFGSGAHLWSYAWREG
jgi:hypothetical protein